jgi:simple sugar transport system ATP-binding protein
VIAEGELVFETPAARADRTVLGQHMAGHGDTPMRPAVPAEKLREAIG